jgi:mannose-6-phosphate isomerase-like protein (cupin superfamily)
MIVRKLKDCAEITAGDGSALRELFHRAKGEFPFGYSLAHAVVKPGERTKLHRLKSSEVYYILAGHGLIRVEREAVEVAAGQAVYIPPFRTQSIENTGETNLAFLCIVDPAWDPGDEEVLPEGTTRER